MSTPTVRLNARPEMPDRYKPRWQEGCLSRLEFLACQGDSVQSVLAVFLSDFILDGRPSYEPTKLPVDDEIRARSVSAWDLRSFDAIIQGDHCPSYLVAFYGPWWRRFSIASFEIDRERLRRRMQCRASSQIEIPVLDPRELDAGGMRFRWLRPDAAIKFTHGYALSSGILDAKGVFMPARPSPLIPATSGTEAA